MPYRRIRILSRIAASLLGGWFFVWGFSTLMITGLVTLGQPYDEAYTATMLLAFLVFLGMFLWSFTATNLTHLWVLLAGGGVTMTTAAWALQYSLV